MRKFLLAGLAFFIFHILEAQDLSIRGTIQDQQTKISLSGATVKLSSITNSAVLQTVLSDSLGEFVFKQLKPDSFLITVSFVGYTPVLKRVRLDSTDIMIHINAVSNSSQEMATVVIRAFIPPATQKDDTLQINASQFKVNPDASGEDLIKKVPGVTVENGQVKAQGENVQKVTIDGRELFGDDATAALRNLPAEIIDKIQIFDRLSDQAQFTGFDDGSATKSINIITKANMRNGQFGRVYAGYGTDDRYQAGGNSTILHGSRRISLVGNFNNINQQNFSQQDLLGVTSSNQRGGGGGNRGQGGNRQGGANRGNQGGGGSGFGNFGTSANFLVGQQNGINKTNAFGVNYSDVWGKKITATGSYFFNNTKNTTNELSSTQYFAGNYESGADTSSSVSRNTNHRINTRIEYRIDSANQIIFTPTLSFQDNESVSQTGSLFNFIPDGAVLKSFNQNNANSNRNGNNLSNNILYRHSFPKKGRTFSANINTSYNQKDGESYINTYQKTINTIGFEDSASRRYTDQFSNGLLLSTNLVYTEPLGKNTQLQVNYNPSFSKNTSNQQTYGYDNLDEKFSQFLPNLSNKFENRTNAQNAGIAYRYGLRDKQISFGANYQSTSLSSEQVFPATLTVDKTFQNILPNLMFRYTLSSQSTIRFTYRTNVNTPSVTQLQNVVDIVNAPTYNSGNPDLNPQYSHILNGRYTFTNTGKGFLFVGNVFWQTTNNYIANASFTPRKDSAIGNGIVLHPGDQLNKPVNLNGYSSLRSFITMAIPLRFIKSNFNLNGGITYTNTPGIIDYISNETKNTIYTIGTVIASNISQYIDFTVSYTANFNKVSNDLVTSSNGNYFQHIAGVRLNLLSKTGWFFQNDLNNQYFTGLSQGTTDYWLWNISAGKKILKKQAGELKLSVFDLLKQNRSITRNVLQNGYEDVQSQVLKQYFMLTFTYSLRNFGTARK